MLFESNLLHARHCLEAFDHLLMELFPSLLITDQTWLNSEEQ